MSINIVLGPPVAGKSEHVKAHAKDGNVIVDYDLIARAMGSRVAHDSSGSVRIVALESRKTAIERILRGIDDDAWIIHTNPQPKVMRAYVEAGAKFTMLDPGKDEVLRRAKASERPASTVEAIEAWYANPPVIPEPKEQRASTVSEGRVMDLQEAFDRGFEAVKAYVDAEIAAAAILPPDLAAEVARAVRLLHEAPAPIERSATRVVRIERDDDGNLMPIYEAAP